MDVHIFGCECVYIFVCVYSCICSFVCMCMHMYRLAANNE